MPSILPIQGSPGHFEPQGGTKIRDQLRALLEAAIAAHAPRTLDYGHVKITAQPEGQTLQDLEDAYAAATEPGPDKQLRAQAAQQQAALRRKAEEQRVAELSKGPGRTGDALWEGVRQDAVEAGWGSVPDMFAIRELEHHGEIAEWGGEYIQRYGDVAITNIRDYVVRDAVRWGTASAWRSLLDDHGQEG